MGRGGEAVSRTSDVKLHELVAETDLCPTNRIASQYRIFDVPFTRLCGTHGDTRGERIPDHDPGLSRTMVLGRYGLSGSVRTIRGRFSFGGLVRGRAHVAGD